MAQLLIRNLDEETVNELKALATEHGRSLQSELKRILTEVIRTSKKQNPYLTALRIRKKLKRNEVSE